jgi:hypothetical protein
MLKTKPEVLLFGLCFLILSGFEVRFAFEFAAERYRSVNIGVRGFEPPTSASQTLRATNCATPRYSEYTDYLVTGSIELTAIRA